MKNALNSVKISKPSTNAFDLSHDIKLSMQMGDLVPVLAMECLPGDRVRLGCENLIRLAPMLAPMMHRVDVRVEYFFVPNRLIWENWETWITNGGADPATLGDALPAHPTLKYSSTGTAGVWDYQLKKLLDYMGLPDPEQCPIPALQEQVSALPFAAYQKIYDDYYRDENLVDQEPNAWSLDDGDNTPTTNPGLMTLRKRAWEADYFNKALPFAQKGEPVDLPLTNIGDVPVRMNLDTAGGTGVVANAGTGVNPILIAADTPINFPAGQVDHLFAETSLLSANASSINDLRLAFRLQEWLEKNARGGTRYSEIIRAHFNVRPEDSRMQRSEYIVGIKNPIQVSEVLNTTGTDDAPQGNMAGHGVSYNRGNYGKYFCSEHGYIIGIMSVMPKPAYQQGIPKHFLKFTDPTQIAWPTFGNLGEQEIVSREIMAFQDPGEAVEPFGYTPRYMEYKTLPSRVAGAFRTTLNFWHMGIIYDPASPPVLNRAFIESRPTQRIFAVTDPEVDQLYCQVMHHISVVRALPFYGTPTF